MPEFKTPREIDTIAIIGAGTMGHGIAQIAAVSGRKAKVYDPAQAALAALPGKVEANLASFVSAGLLLPEQVEPALGRISVHESLQDCLMGAACVIEAAPERLALKQDLFARIEAAAEPDALFLTNTSGLKISEVGAKLADPSRLVGAHFWNPPHVVPCVEISKAQATDPKAWSLAYDLMEAMGRKPVKLKRDVLGFLGNRMQHAMQREALALLEEGVADPEDIDRVVKYGFGLRLAVMGPIERADLGGLDVTLGVQDYLLADICNRPGPNPSLVQKVKEGNLGIKTGKGFYDWTPESIQRAVDKRDRALLAILKLLEDLD